MSNFVINCHNFYREVAPFYNHTSSVWEFGSSTSSLRFVVGVKWFSIMVLFRTFLMTNEVEYLFTCLCIISISFMKPFFHLKVLFIYILLLVTSLCVCSLCIIDTCTFLDTCITGIFPILWFDLLFSKW